MLLPSQAQKDEQYMRLALAQATLAEQAGEVPIGAVLVRDEAVIASAYNHTIKDCDPSGHAEVMALRQAGQALQNHRLTGATLYVTLEPCLMCLGAVVQARIVRLVFGAYDKRAGACGSAFDLAYDKALNHRIREVKGGVLEAPCRELLQGFFQQRRCGSIDILPRLKS